MREQDVPQDSGVLGEVREVAYAVGDDGRYVLRPSSGWEPANLANRQAWTVIHEEVEAALEAIRAGEKSPLAFYMALNQMDVGLLAQYVGLARWRVRRHVKPAVFNRLKPELLQRYSALFRVTPTQLQNVPDRVEMPPCEPLLERNEPL